MAHDEFLIFLTAVLSVVGFIGMWIIKGATKNTSAIIELTLEVKYLREAIGPVRRLEQDIAILNEWKNQHSSNKISNGASGDPHF